MALRNYQPFWPSLNHGGMQHPEEVSKGRDRGETEGAGEKHEERMMADGFYAKNGLILFYSLTTLPHHLFLHNCTPSHHALILHVVFPPRTSLLTTSLPALNPSTCVLTVILASHTVYYDFTSYIMVVHNCYHV